MMKREELEVLDKGALVELVLALTATVSELAAKVAELEARLNQNSSNSSKPPSSDPPWMRPQAKRTKTGKKPGGQPGHKGHGLAINREPDEIVELRAANCGRCGADLSGEEGDCRNIRYLIDIRIKTVITAFRQMESICPDCGAENLAAFPPGVTGTKQYGNGVRAISVLLTNYAMVGIDKTQRIISDVFDVPLSTGTIVSMTKDCAVKSEPLLQEVADRLKNAAVIHNDETGVRVNGERYWLHTASNREATYNTVSPKRGQEGIDGNGVLKDFKGTAVHDCWQSYFKYDNCDHALCNAHLLRELTAVTENTEQKWAGQMKELILEMKKVTERYKEAGRKGLSGYYDRKFTKEYDRITELGESENPLREGSRNRSRPRCLLDRFIKYHAEICRFASDFRVPFDNNQAERDIRNAKVKQKVSGGFRTDNGVENYGKISSVIGTAVKQGMSAFHAVSGVVSGKLSSLFSPQCAATE